MSFGYALLYIISDDYNLTTGISHFNAIIFAGFGLVFTPWLFTIKKIIIRIYAIASSFWTAGGIYMIYTLVTGGAFNWALLIFQAGLAAYAFILIIG